MDPFAPRPVVGASDQPITLTGKLMPWEDKHNGPVLLNMPMSDAFYLPLFDTTEQLKGVLGRAGAPFDRIKQIEDGVEFVLTLATSVGDRPLKIITDIRFTESGTVRFKEIFR